MENTYKLNVPLKVEIETGKDWYEAKQKRCVFTSFLVKKNINIW